MRDVSALAMEAMALREMFDDGFCSFVEASAALETYKRKTGPFGTLDLEASDLRWQVGCNIQPKVQAKGTQLSG